ncbi:MAG: hypothetical protein KGK08_13165 [Acidobacteriota bacterium]|nr:hypothetical protein [Acidobacteriota bacterium]
MDRIVAVDWSGDKGPGQRKKLWAGVWTAATNRVTLHGGRDRMELMAWLVELARETPRLVVGLDCCFGFPAWFVQEQGCGSAQEFWRQVAEGQGEAWLARECADERFWGVKGPARSGRRPARWAGEGLRQMLRTTDWENKVAQSRDGGDPERAAKMAGIQAKSPFQIGGSGSVGTGSLRAMPWLLHLQQAGFCIWPFEDAALGSSPPRPLLVEIYTRLLTGAVKKSNAEARRAYLAARRASPGDLYGSLSRPVLQHAQVSEDAFDALVCCVEMVRWQQEFAGLRATPDAVLQLEGITWRPGVQR